MRHLLLLGFVMAATGALAQQPGTSPPAQVQPAPPPQAQPSQPGAAPQVRATVEREFKAQPGQEVRIGVFATIKPDCTPDQLPAVKLGEPPKHGQVTVKQGKVRLTNHKQCLAAEVPAFVAFYKAKPDFPGRDVLTLEVRDKNGRLQVQRITITTGTGKPAGDSI